MGLLFPLYLLGFAAIAAPVILHLTRRTPKEKVPFSSLMFLREAPLRLKRRSRLEQLFLLALRCLALLLLALAFARPLWKNEDSAHAGTGSRQLVYLLDTSASMSADGQMQQAIETLATDAQELKTGDQVSVIAFNDQSKTLIDFTTGSSLSAASAQTQLTEWTRTPHGGSRLGLALVQAAHDLEDAAMTGFQQHQEIVVVSDLQEGVLLDELYAFEWPEDLHVRLLALDAPDPNNASMQWVQDAGDGSLDEEHPIPWIRISNQAGADRTLMQVAWADTPDQKLSIEVPAGQSKVIKAPVTASGVPGKELVLSGDALTYDNHLFIAPVVDRQINVLFIGRGDEKDAEQPYYFLRRALLDTRVFTPVITVRRGSDPLEDIDTTAIDFCVITEPVSNASPIRSWLERGGTAIYMTGKGDNGESLHQLTGEDWKLREATVKEYALMGHLDLKHPWLEAFSDPQFGDFSKIHFWHYRQAESFTAKVLARFDGVDPALMEAKVGNGRIVIITAGWHPADSQLSLSSRFVPLLYSLLEYGQSGISGRHNMFVTGSAIPVPEGADRLEDPDGVTIPLSADQRSYTETHQTGLYHFLGPELELPFAINLPPGESRVEILPDEERLQLTRLGQRPENEETQAAASKHEVENQQKLWRWLIVGLWAALILETGIAGRRGRPVGQPSTAEHTA